MMLSTASSHSCCNLIKDLREKKRKPNKTHKTKRTRSALWIQDQPKLLFESKVWHSLCMYVCVCEWERQRQRALRERSKASGKEIKSFKYQDQSRSKKHKTKCKSAPQMQKHKVSNDDDDDDCLMLLLFLSFFACFLDRLEMGTKNACFIYYWHLLCWEWKHQFWNWKQNDRPIWENQNTDRKERESGQIVIRFIFFLLNPKPLSIAWPKTPCIEK